MKPWRQYSSGPQARFTPDPAPVSPKANLRFDGGREIRPPSVPGANLCGDLKVQIL